MICWALGESGPGPRKFLMSRQSKQMKALHVRPNLSAWTIAGIYAVAGYLWILFSDQILEGLVDDTSSLSILQTYKGWFYVGMTAWLIQWLVKRRLVAIKQVQTVLQEREVRFRGLFENSPIPLVEADLSPALQQIVGLRKAGITDFQAYIRDYPEKDRQLSFSVVIREVNEATAKLFRADSQEELRGLVGNLHSEGLHHLVRDLVCHFATGNNHFQEEATLRARNGEQVTVLASATLSPGYEANWKRVLVSLADLTAYRKAEAERTRLEAQLRQAQKMESIGALAGGIAHDFNNILTPLCGYADLALEDLPLESPLREDITQVQKAAYRGKDLVKQILSFSRKSDQQKVVVDLRMIVKETAKLLRSSLPPSIDIALDLDRKIGNVLADPTQIHQVLMNLCTNAFHAMKENGGQLTISLNQLHVDESVAPHLASGEYVACAVADTGCGILPENQERIFEPFFTTKEAGEGTGLGLSVSHGIVVSHGGTITCSSQPLIGSTFTVYLPITQNELEQDAVTPQQSLRGSEQILIVDDDPLVAKVATEMLLRQGYKVRYLSSAVDALELLRSPDCEIGIALFNQAMPRISGIKLAEAVRVYRPDLPIAILTGFGKGLETAAMESAGIQVIIAKPFTAAEIAQGVRTAIDGRAQTITPRLVRS